MKTNLAAIRFRPDCRLLHRHYAVGFDGGLQCAIFGRFD